MSAARSAVGPFAAVGGSVILWSTAYAASGYVLESGSPAVLSVGRFALALVVLVPLALRRRGFARALASPFAMLLGLTGVSLYYSLTNIGMLFTTAGIAALTSALLPVLTAGFGRVLLGERIPRRAGLGLLIATAGVVVIAAAGLSLDLGLLLCIGAIVSYALYTVLLRRSAVRAAPMGRTDALSLATATSVWGVVFMLPWLLIEALSGTASLPSGAGGILTLLFLGLVVSAPTMVLFNYGAERLPAVVSGVLTAGIPALGYAVAVIAGEPLDPIRALGGGIALVGILIATTGSPTVELDEAAMPEPAEPETQPIPVPPTAELAPPSPFPAPTAPIEIIREGPAD